MKTKILFLCSLYLLSMSSFAQERLYEVEDTLTPIEEVSEPQKPITRKEKRRLKKAIRKLQKNVLTNSTLARRYIDILDGCDDLEKCQDEIDDLSQDSIQGTALEKSNGVTFGICKPVKENKQIHMLVYAKREYDCKLSSFGKVYNKKLYRKITGPGLFWDKQSLVMVCTGPSYGKKMAGWVVSAGVGGGITATTVFGSIGACISVGAGISAGALIGVDQYRFEE